MLFENLLQRLASLPVASIAAGVTESVFDGKATILTSPTGSGKTLYQSCHLAATLDGIIEGPLVVLVPRRFLAVNAAETVAELAECEVGGLVGYAVGSQAGDKSCWNPESTKLLFATYGYAISSGLIWRAEAFMNDEVHEQSMDMSIARAIQYHRLTKNESLMILEASATINPTRQAEYWSAIASTQIFETDGQLFPCERRHRPAGDPTRETIELIREGKRGILVFRPGVGEVEETAEEIVRLAQAAEIDVEVAQIYGEMAYAERAIATRRPKEGGIKVLVGTNVVETGANIPWLDAGVSCGTGKENSVRPITGATYLALIELPQWRLEQQEGRVKRFGPGVFVLCSPFSWGQRPVETSPEIERLSLTELVMHCASFGFRAHDLRFDYAPDPAKILEAETKLQHLGLLDDGCNLTDAGEMMQGLPIGPETGASLWMAKQMDCLSIMLPQAVIMEVDGLRKDFRLDHGLDRESDLIDGLKAFSLAHEAEGAARRAMLEEYNVGFKRFQAACELLYDLERRLGVTASFDIEGNEALLRQCILAGSLDRLFVPETFRGSLRPVIGSPYALYNIGQGSCVMYVPSGSFVAGSLRVITPRDKWKSPFTVVEKVTVVTMEDLQAVNKMRSPGILSWSEKTDDWMFSRRRKTTTTLLFEKYVLDQTVETIEEEPEVRPQPRTPTRLAFDEPDDRSFRTLGDILAARLLKK